MRTAPGTPILFTMRAAYALGITIALAAGCAPPASKGGFDSPSPGANLYAILEAARTNDRTAIPHLVEQLYSDDPAVRFAAIETLEQMTGETYGYRYYDDPMTRREAISRWVEAVENGELDAARATPDATGFQGSSRQ